MHIYFLIDNKTLKGGSCVQYKPGREAYLP